VSASAAQLVAPVEYRPSTIVSNIFGTNQQKETSLYTALKPDGENDVASLGQCNLSVKYPIKINGIYTNISKSYTNYSGAINQRGKSYPTKETDKDYVQYEDVTELRLELADNRNPGTISDYINFLAISCVKNEKALARIENAGKKITKEELFEKTGWFITQNDIKNIEYQTTLNESSKITFQHQDLFYSINTAISGWKDSAIHDKEVINNPKNWKLFGSSVQLQFNSLVKNETNKQIETNFYKPLKSDNKNDVVSLD